MVEFAVVRFFLKDSDKDYGFANVLDKGRTQTGEEIFLHHSDGRFIEHDRTHSRFAKATLRLNGQVLKLRPPEEGSRIVFVRQHTNKNVRARCWGYTSEWFVTPWRIAQFKQHDSSSDKTSEEGGLLSAIILSGTTAEPLVSFKDQTSESLKFTTSTLHRHGGGVGYTYYLQLRLGGAWHNLKEIMPTRAT